ncbi:MFS general substrate transporter [Byssothecium circinans]|uniref:MFS general substrate transporter n=1 Tax=Byssothecium circinans TaxID=147558 RepID=A0A6A5TQA9_9PLEO|nr:MFS general substrate transporter [Byssothecium circinans]
MAPPASHSSSSRETEVLQDEKVDEAYIQGREEEISNQQTHPAPNHDVEKALHGTSVSTHSDDPTLDVGSVVNVQEEEPRDPNIRKKWGLLACLSSVTLVTPLASSFFAPGVPQVLETFNETSNLIAGLIVSIYILGFAIGPLIIAPMSELYGRFLLYNICNLLFVVFTVCCAVSNSMGMLIAFRLLAGCAGAAPVTLGGGSIADIFPREKRAGAMAIWSMGPLLGPVLGPVAGGFLIQAKGWRWVFYILIILGDVFSILLFFVGSETYPPTLLARRAARLRKETGNPHLHSALAKNMPPREVFLLSIVRPMKMLLLSPIVLLTSTYIAVNYGILYLFFTTITFVFKETYRFSTSLIGLAYLGMGVGMVLGVASLGLLSDKVIRKQQRKGDDDVRPEHRLALHLTVPGAVLMPIGVFIYGWTTDRHVRWIVPIIASTFGIVTGMTTIQTYLIDAFTLHAASALAAITVLRSVFGAFLPLAGLDLFDALGLGWGNSLLAFVGLAMVPVPVAFSRYGEGIRTRWTA